MNPTTDPDPARPSPPTRSARPLISVSWSPAAKREYSRLEEMPTRAALGAVARKAARLALRTAPSRLPLPEQAASLQELSLALDVSIVSDEEIMKLNATHRGKNKPTDVLSFSQLEGESMPFATEEILLGDLVISVETAVRQARELKHSLEQEMTFLTIHGVLHLCGYDHDTSSKRRTMWKQQDKIVQLFSSPKPKP